MPRLVDELPSSGIGCEVVFLRAENEMLLKRFSETRRRHPLSRAGLGLQEALEQERRLLAPVAQCGRPHDRHVAAVRARTPRADPRAHRRASGTRGPSLLFQSFAYRHGVPDDADFVFDARSLPNPYWEPELRELTGRDQAVAEFLDCQPEVRQLPSAT